MAAGDEEKKKREADAVGEPRGQRVAFEVVDGEERLPRDERQRLCRGEPDDDAADQPRPRGGGKAIDLRELQAGSR